MIMRKRLLPIILAVLMVFTMMPASAGIVYAANGDPAMTLGPYMLDQNVNTSTAQTVWYANEAWRVIGYDGYGAASENDTVTLLSARNLDLSKFGEKRPLSNVYADSTLKVKVDAIAGSFAEGEQSAIVKRTLVRGKYNGKNTDCIAGNEDIPDVLLWPLSAKEANDVNSDLRILDPAHPAWATSYSWLRSPGEDDYWAGYINGSGGVDYSGESVGSSFGVRTAFYLDPGSVLFTSAAENGKVSGTEGANALEKQSDLTNSGDEWKVTLRSGHEDFKISECIATINCLKFKYTGATVGTEDKPEYISAVITDKPVTDTSAAIKYYGRIQTCTSKSGSVRINTAGKLGDNEYLYIFNEQYNGDKSTDYASALQEFRPPEPISYDVTFKVANGSWNDGTKKDKIVTLNGHEGDTLKLASEQIPEAGDKPDENCKAGSWDTAPSADTAITENTTYTYTYTDQAVENVIAMIEALPEIDAMKRTDAAAVQEAKDAYDALTEVQKAQIDAAVTTRLNKAVDRAGKIVAEAAEAADLRDRAVVDLAQLDKLVDGSLYRAASYRNYVDAYEAFNDLVDDNEATTEQLRTARSAVIKAYKNLEKKIDISDSEITGLKAVSYTGKAQTQKPVVTLDGTTLNPDTEYKVSYKNNIKAGTATVIVTGIGDDHTGTATAAFKINKAANPLKISAKTATVKYSKLKKKAQTLAITKVIKFTKKLNDKKTYTLVSAKKGSKSFRKYFTINKTTGKVSVKKGLKKGTYKVKVKVKALGNNNYKASGLKSVTFTVKVK